MSDTCTRSIPETDFEQEVHGHKGDVLVDFYTSTCSPCKAMAPVLDTVCTERRGALKVLKINAEESINLAVRLQIQSVPTFILYRDGQVVGRTRGLQPKRLLDQWIDESLARA